MKDWTQTVILFSFIKTILTEEKNQDLKSSEIRIISETQDVYNLVHKMLCFRKNGTNWTGKDLILRWIYICFLSLSLISNDG